jgi:Uma2 family endonuclease
MVVKLGLRSSTIAELHERLGWVPLHRIRLNPPPGTATEADLIRVRNGPEKLRCELVDGTLVEVPVGMKESILAIAIAGRIRRFTEPQDLGVVAGSDGPVRLMPGNVRYPDVSYFPWDLLPGDEVPDEAIWSVVPPLAVEVLSRSNTRQEIDRKVSDFFRAGCRLVWIIDPATETAMTYASAGRARRIGPGEALDGGKVLPGFKLPLADLFAATKRRKKKSK